jgi:hypothetical protein
MYHVSPRYNREAILREGLRGHTGDPDVPRSFEHDMPQGNYLFLHPQDAAKFADAGHHYNEDTGITPPYDIYRVDARGLPVARDPEMQMYGDSWTNETGPSDFDHWQVEPDDGKEDGWPTVAMRFYSPSHIGPERLSLMPEDDWAYPDGYNEVPVGWDRMPWTNIPQPTHEN